MAITAIFILPALFEFFNMRRPQREPIPRDGLLCGAAGVASARASNTGTLRFTQTKGQCQPNRSGCYVCSCLRRCHHLTDRSGSQDSYMISATNDTCTVCMPQASCGP